MTTTPKPKPTTMQRIERAKAELARNDRRREKLAGELVEALLDEAQAAFMTCARVKDLGGLLAQVRQRQAR